MVFYFHEWFVLVNVPKIKCSQIKRWFTILSMKVNMVIFLSIPVWFSPWLELRCIQWGNTPATAAPYKFWQGHDKWKGSGTGNMSSAKKARHKHHISEIIKQNYKYHDERQNLEITRWMSLLLVLHYDATVWIDDFCYYTMKLEKRWCSVF